MSARSVYAAAAVALVALAIGACGSTESGPASAPPSESPTTGTSGYEIVTVEQSVPEDWAREPGPRPEVSADLIARMNDLGLQLWQFQRSVNPGESVWLSPVSVFQVLSLLAPGTGPEAVDELLAAMGLDAEALGTSTEELADWITASRRSDYQMALYNAAFVAEQNGGFAPTYLDAIEPIRDELGAFNPLDPQATADLINGRVEEHTRGLIEEIVAPGDIHPTLVFILLNTTAFKGEWVDQFDPMLTDDRDFTLLDGSVFQVPRMVNFVPLALTSGEGYTAAALPYEGGATAVVVLPDQGRFDDVAAALTVADLRRSADADPVGTGALGLPKFTSDSGVQELSPALQSAGVEQLFTQTPDWPMFGNGVDLAVDFVNHRVVVAVNELGTEAAAATAVGGLGGDDPELSFIVDRPFLMAILDADGAVLFLGQVTDPR